MVHERWWRSGALRKGALVPAVIFALGAGWLSVIGAPCAHASSPCGNEAIRDRQSSTYLPECRAYELVTPLQIHPNLTTSELPYVGSGHGTVEAQAASSGDAIAYPSWYPPSETPTVGQYFLSQREGDHWTTSDLTPPYGPDTRIGCFGKLFPNEDLNTEVLFTEAPECNIDEPPLAAGEPRNEHNLFIANLDSLGSFQLVNLTPEGVTPATARFQGESANGRRVVFDEAAPLVTGAPAGDDLYIWSEGIVRLITYDPAGNPEGGILANGAYTEQADFGSSPATDTHAVSSDGESVFFEAGGKLYLRTHAAQAQSIMEKGACKEPELACTVEVDKTVAGATGSSGGGTFQWASVEGTKVFFTDESRLTPGSTAESSRPDLYEYEVATGDLNDLTAHVGEAANVQGVAGAAENGSYVYFVANGALTSAQNSRGQHAQGHKPNLYVASSGGVAFVATLSAGDDHDWGANDPEKPTRVVGRLTSAVTAEGTMIAFNSVEQLTEYDNAPKSATQCWGTASEDRAGAPCNEIFEYSATSGQLSCVSCGPPGSQPTGAAELREPAGVTQRRPLMANGRAFFDTPSKLASREGTSRSEIAVSDVYEWAPVGVGECTAASPAYSPTAEGCQYLISGGTSTEPSYFVDASENGEDVYFFTTEALVGADTDNDPSLYDARVGGEPVEPRAIPGCAGEECRGQAPSSPALGAPETTIFTGPGNPIAGKAKLTRQQLLRRALKACESKPRKKRQVCRARARRRYGGKPKKSAKSMETQHAVFRGKRGGRQ